MLQIDCGIDIGSTNLKVILVTEGGQMLTVRSVPAPRVNDDFGPVTDALALVNLLEEMIVDCWGEVADGQPLRSIAATGVGEDGVAVMADLTPTGLAIPWFDARAMEEAAFLRQYSNYTHRTGIALGPDRTAAKWLWTHRHRPKEFADADRWIALTDFPAAYWTGRSFMSASLAPRTACFDVFRRSWIADLLSAAHSPRLPEILDGGTPVGHVSKGRLLESGAASHETVVAVGGHDHPVAASVVRGFDSGIVDSLGTANLLYGVSDSLEAADLSESLALSLPPDGSPGLAILGVLELSAALNVTGMSPSEIRSYLSQKTLPGTPPRSASALNAPQASKELQLRRVLERECLHARAIAREMASLGVPSGKIYATGGWSRSYALMTLRASVFGQPLQVIDDLELSALGAAQLGAKAATGRWICNIRTDNIKCVYPLAEWVPYYKALASELGCR